MIKLTKFIYNSSFTILKFISLIFALFLLMGALLFTSSDPDIRTLKTYVTADNIFVGFISILAVLCLTILLYYLTKKHPVKTVRTLLIGTLLTYAIAGTCLILFVKSMPNSDSKFIYDIVQNFANGDFSDINADSYLSVYPHQIGLVFFYEPLLRIFNSTSLSMEPYVFFQFFNLLLVLTLIYFLYKLTDRLFHNTFITACFLCLILGCLPLYFYILRIYGEIPSLSFFVVGLWAFVEILSKKPQKTLRNMLSVFCLSCLSILCFIISVATRKNIIINLIAIMMIAFLVMIYHKRWSLLPLCLCYLLIAILTLPVIQTSYETRAENHLDAGTPAIAYIAMGMQNAPKACGWYNAFNYNIYVETGHDMDFIDMYSKKIIKDRLTYFNENPSSCYDFYFEKYSTQWCDGTYAVRELTSYTTCERSDYWNTFYSKDSGKTFLFLCNSFQTILYLGVLLFALKNFLEKKEKTILPYLLILIAFGGFLFHFLWEANARAIFSYTVLLLPVSAAGIAFAALKIYGLITQK